MSEPKTRLLVIDDDASVLEVIRRQLGAAEPGLDIHVATDGRQGLEATHDLQPDVVLCDWVMPKMSGPEYCRAVRSEPELRATYLALLTARSEEAHQIEGLESGADAYLVKPVPTSELLARVRCGVRARRLQRELLSAEHQAALVELARAAGHEINNPLTALFGHMELVMKYMEMGEASRMTHHIRQSGEMAARIAEVAHRLISLSSPRTTEYLDGMGMLDLDSRPEDRN